MRERRRTRLSTFLHCEDTSREYYNLVPPRFLFAAHPTVGHTNALRGIARELIARGAQVHFALAVGEPPSRVLRYLPEVLQTGFAIADGIAADGIPMIRLPPPARSLVHAAMLPFSRGYDELRRACLLFTEGLAMHAEILAERALSLDAVVADYTFFAASLAAELAGKPYVAFYHSGLPFPVPGAPPFGSDLPFGAPKDERFYRAQEALEGLGVLVDARLADARRTVGLPPIAPRLLERPYGDMNILATHPVIEMDRPPLGETTHWVGPCLGGRRGLGDFPAALLKPDATRVFVSMGTVFNRDADTFLAILRALDKPGYRVIVSAGASFSRLQSSSLGAHIHLFRRVPQLDVLDGVDLVISHGGNNTVNETLAAGRPLVVIPVGGEQQANARRVEAIGAGIAITRLPLTSAVVRAAVQRILADPSYTTRARSIGDTLSGVDGTQCAVDLILKAAS